MGHTIEELRHSLCEVAEPSIAPDMSRYMRGRFEYLGVKAPARRAAGGWTGQRGSAAPGVAGFQGITHIRAEIGVNGVHKRVGAINR